MYEQNLSMDLKAVASERLCLMMMQKIAMSSTITAGFY